mmetsp:Transcript_15264/g.28737  ORF Transcript_15264/g.28737 Transcript_15264/m.28737 type:complete len:106 (-) Transcript_15264:118-435(-)|eukprot:CAMPEP_0176498446 /NCGR_PEP_ID=MMETSP0200_2-20121128/12323_1 /TAXON_ID=947934 /ORGANISM="Chaetoceros sp., Strain GSL56" /LENGTH=105 /DNA_ID=CAMNT_0017896649 /DNA_START=222 /DNA_END=539 /DNA_ORIENTATION=+
MIINAKTVILTLILIAIVSYVGLRFIRQFALSIALENHEANQELDAKEDRERKKRIALADKAASDAFQKVEPLIRKKDIGVGETTNTAGIIAADTPEMELEQGVV